MANPKERLASAAMGALEAHVAIIDHKGFIVFVNEAWLAFAKANGGATSGASTGANYLSVCQRAATEGDEDARNMLGLIDLVSKGESKHETMEYPCHSPHALRWFQASIRRFLIDGDPFLLLSHHDITARIESENRALEMANHDQLTGLPNRRRFEQIAVERLAEAERDDAELAVIFIDVDNLKDVNDAYGHDEGDEILRLVARELSASAGPMDIVSRLGGDEFVALVFPADKSARDAAVVYASGFFSRISGLGSSSVSRISASMGASIYPYDGAEFKHLAAHADEAMYEAKKARSSEVEFFSGRHAGRYLRRVVLDNELQRALERDEFLLHYQPQFWLQSGRLAGLEALVRWQHPTHGLTMPNYFIGRAEDTGLISGISRKVIEMACRDRARWRAVGISPDIPISVNISAIDLRNADFLGWLLDATTSGEISSDGIEFEITEGVAAFADDRILSSLLQLHESGFQIVIDDFGKEYSNLGALLQLPQIRRLKIDRIFIDGIQHARARSIVRAIVAMSHSLGMKVVAEGVETTTQLEALRRTRCDIAQGFLLSKPIVFDAVADILAAEGQYKAPDSISQVA